MSIAVGFVVSNAVRFVMGSMWVVPLLVHGGGVVGAVVDRTCFRACAMWPLMVASVVGQYRAAVAYVRPGHERKYPRLMA